MGAITLLIIRLIVLLYSLLMVYLFFKFNIFSGEYIRKFGDSNFNPYPIGIDITEEGDVLVADSHGNHLHVVVFDNSGKIKSDYKCMTHKVCLYFLIKFF